jgi:hypothetical protein
MPLPTLYQEALSILAEFEDRELLLPDAQYRAGAARALIYSAVGNIETAAEFAHLALAAATRNHSGLPYHPRLGLVEKLEPAIQAKLQEIARSSTSFAPGE